MVTGILAIRSDKVLSSIIRSDLNCVRGRNIASNLHNLNDIVKHVNLKSCKSSGKAK